MQVTVCVCVCVCVCGDGRKREREKKKKKKKKKKEKKEEEEEEKPYSHAVLREEKEDACNPVGTACCRLNQTGGWFRKSMHDSRVNCRIHTTTMAPHALSSRALS